MPIITKTAVATLSLVIASSVLADDSIKEYEERIRQKNSLSNFMLTGTAMKVLDSVANNANAPLRGGATALSDALRGGKKDVQINHLDITKSTEILDINVDDDAFVTINETSIEDTQATTIEIAQRTKMKQVNVDDADLHVNNVSFASFVGSTVKLDSFVDLGNVYVEDDSSVRIGSTTVGKWQ